MVVFTCNHCGESVKKPSVEKHYKMKCRNSVFVSCMDCQKDFRQDYVEHTRCITEAEKYSGKDYVPKDPKNTGLKKQESWLEIVRSILATKEYDVTPQIRGIFQKLEGYDNVPRKKAKFENFVSNSMHVKKGQAEAVWNVLEKALGKLKVAREAQVKISQNANSTEDSKTDEENSKEGLNGVHTKEEAATCTKEKNKKKRLKSNDANSVAEVPQGEPAKKKKKKNKEAVDEVLATNVKETNGFVSKKGKKSKKEERQEEDNGDMEISLNDVGEKSSAEAHAGAENGVTNGSCELTIKTDVADDKEINSSKKDKPKLGEFPWTEVILKILGKHNDEISLEKLKTKVLKKYKDRYHVEEIPSKVERTFKKKLRKSGLFIDNDVVRIVAK